MPEPQTEDPGGRHESRSSSRRTTSRGRGGASPARGRTVEISPQERPERRVGRGNRNSRRNWSTRSTGRQSVDRRRLVVAGAVIAVVALFVGWALGRSGGSPAGGRPSRRRAPPRRRVWRRSRRQSMPSTVPATTRPVVRRGPTTTTVPEWQTTTVEVDPAAAALGHRRRRRGRRTRSPSSTWDAARCAHWRRTPHSRSRLSSTPARTGS